MGSDPNSRYFKLEQNSFKGLNLDIPPDKLPPDFFSKLTNMMVGDSGLPETVNGCTLLKNIGANAGKSGYFQTRGEDYIFIYNKTNGSVGIYKSPTYDLEETLFEDNPLSSEPWFAEHVGEFYMGNMEDGIWRWSPGHQSLIRGSAPMDIFVQAGEEGELEKGYIKWLFAYDYEYRGGRSPMSRNVEVNLFKSVQKVEITMDIPPDISKNRRIYASPDDGITWYFVKEVTNSSTSMVELDEELVNRISVEWKYDPLSAKPVSPKSLMGFSHDNKLWLAYTVDSPTIVRPSKIGQPYWDDMDAFDLMEVPTDILGKGNYVIVSTTNKIFALQSKPDEQNEIVNEGAYRGSLQIWNNSLVWVNEKGHRIFDGTKVDTISGINSIDLSNLQKEKRFELWTTQRDFNRGVCEDGVSTDVIPGAISLQSMEPTLGTGIIERQNNNTTNWFETHNGQYHAIRFNNPGPVGQKYSFSGLGLYMQRRGKFEKDFVCEVWGDVDEKPDSSNIIASFAEKIGEDAKTYNFMLKEYKELEYNTDYWLVVPFQGTDGQSWRLFYVWVRPSSDNEASKMYSYYLQESDDGENWSQYTQEGYPAIPRFILYGSGAKIFTPSNWSDIENGNEATDNLTMAVRFKVDEETTLDRGINFIHSVVGSPTNPVITIQADVDGHPEGTGIGTALDYGSGYAFETGDVMPTILVKYNWNNKYVLQPDTYYWFVIEEKDVANYRKYATGEKHAIDICKYTYDGITWSGWGYVMWVKLWGSVPGEASSATSGSWIGDILDKSGDNDFDKFEKLYVQMMIPGTTADVRVDVWTWVDATHEYTDEDVTLPFDIDVAHPGAKKAQVTIDIDLGDANFTPTVDSILLFYKRTGDDGDILHSVNLKGSYCLSLEDFNGVLDNEFSYMLSKYGFWNKLDRAFYDYLPVGDDVVLGVGKNPNETYRNLYSLDIKNITQWFDGDATTTVNIDTELQTGYLLYDYVVKELRKLFLTVKGTQGKEIGLELEARGSERLASDDVREIYHDVLELNDMIKTLYFSLPDRMHGKYCQLRLFAYGVKWSLSGYVLEYWRKMVRNISLPTFSSLEYLWYIDNGDGNKIKTFNLKTGSYVSYVINPNANVYSCIDVKRNYLAAIDVAGYFYIYSIASNGVLTLLNTGGTQVGDPREGFSCIMDSGVFNAYAVILSYPAENYTTKIYKINLSDKGNPSVSVEADITSIVDLTAQAINWSEDSLIVVSSSSTSIAKWDIKTKVLTPIGSGLRNYLDVYNNQYGVSMGMIFTPGHRDIIKVYDLKNGELFSETTLEASGLYIVGLSFDSRGNLYVLLRYLNGVESFYLRRYSLDLTLLKSINLGVSASGSYDLNLIAKDDVYVFYHPTGDTEQIRRYDKDLVLRDTYKNTEFGTMANDGYLALQNKHG